MEIEKGFTIDQIKKALKIGWENLTDDEQEELLQLAEELGVSYDTVEEMTEHGSTGGYAYANAMLITKKNTGMMPFQSNAETRAIIAAAIISGATNIPQYMKDEYLAGIGYWWEGVTPEDKKVEIDTVKATGVG